MLLRFHPQGSDAGGLAVRLAVQLVAVEAGAHPGGTEEAAHVSLSHVAAGARDAEELGDAAGRVRVSMGGHAGGHRLAGDHTGGHRGGGSVVANPGGILDLGVGKEESGLSRAQGPCRCNNDGMRDAGPHQHQYPQTWSQWVCSKIHMPAWTGAGSMRDRPAGAQTVPPHCRRVSLFPLPATSLWFGLHHARFLWSRDALGPLSAGSHGLLVQFRGDAKQQRGEMLVSAAGELWWEVADSLGVRGRTRGIRASPLQNCILFCNSVTVPSSIFWVVGRGMGRTEGVLGGDTAHPVRPSCPGIV